MTRLLAQVFGTIENPYDTIGGPLGYTGSDQGSGLVVILNTLLRTAVVVAGLYALINFILAGFSFMSAGGDSKAVGKAWEKIWQSLIGLLVVAGSMLLAGLFGYLLYGDASAITQIKIFTPQ